MLEIDHSLSPYLEMRLTKDKAGAVQLDVLVHSERPMIYERWTWQCQFEDHGLSHLNQNFYQWVLSQKQTNMRHPAVVWNLREGLTDLMAQLRAVVTVEWALEFTHTFGDELADLPV